MAQDRRSRPWPGFGTPGIDENPAKLLERETALPVDLATVADGDDEDHEHLVPHLVEGSVVT